MTSFLAHYGVLAVFALMVVDAVFPAASELVMLYGGALASGALTHRMDVVGWHPTGFAAYLAVVAAGVLGYQVGAIAGWWIGDHGGRPLIERRGRWFHLTAERLERAEDWFERFDDWAALVGRVTPIARSFISIPAGIFEMSFRRYAVLTLVGNAVWCLALAGIGWALGSSWNTFHRDFRFVDYAVVAVIVVGVGGWLLRRRRRTRIR